MTFENCWSIDFLLEPWFTCLSLSSCKWYSKSVVFGQMNTGLQRFRVLRVGITGFKTGWHNRDIEQEEKTGISFQI